MAAIHILTVVAGKLQVVYHLDIPAGTNQAGVPYRTALVNSKLGGTTILPVGDETAGTILQSEKTAIEAGQRYELVAEIDLGANWDALSTAAKNAHLDAHASAVASQQLAYLQRVLRYFGHTRGA